MNLLKPAPQLLLLATLLAGLTFSNSPAVAWQEPAPAVQAQSSKSMVASVHPLATQAGIDALNRGGNAVDAAIATALTLGVVDGYNSGIGGGCFVLIRRADGQIIAIDGREMAPAAAHLELFREAEKRMEAPSRIGALAAGVPGALKAYEQTVRAHGRLKFSELLLPAAEIAERGFEVTPTYAAKLKSAAAGLARFPASAEVFLKQDTEGSWVPRVVGDRIVQADLANTYRQIANQGLDWFYGGPFAKQTAAWMKENDGIMTVDDFRNYKTVQRDPVKTTYRGLDVVGFPPPSSGGVHVAQILNILESFDLAEMHQRDPAEMYHVIAEAMKFAFADRAHWLGDPDFVDVPRGLIDQSYADQIAKKIQFGQAIKTRHGTPPNAETDIFERHTTHVAAADAEGNWVAITTTVNTTFGSKVVVPGLGVVMNNQMDDFVAVLGRPNAYGLVGGKRNAVEAGKRPLSSMSPTIVLRDGQPILSVGAAGGPKIITEVINAIVHHLDLGKPIAEAIAQPRIHHQWAPHVLTLEKGFDAATQQGLQERGHQIRNSTSAGICQGISFDPQTGMFSGAADPRTSGQAAGQ